MLELTAKQSDRGCFNRSKSTKVHFRWLSENSVDSSNFSQFLSSNSIKDAKIQIIIGYKTGFVSITSDASGPNIYIFDDRSTSRYKESFFV